ncbi:hypothetical protein Y88_3315 [Novosphingobium nitrogenifigens DSM 19370]|uniref:Uncharacterized protein n=1 Tax=Novosphingobium nitrogenifigens DSM 19370 TaxID=983920 RepID=F1ZBU0_9SPHN|nr:hypothetical protein Y88_3315 [Novosphingobium nitrogenifigens DSM 19370]
MSSPVFAQCLHRRHTLPSNGSRNPRSGTGPRRRGETYRCRSPAKLCTDPAFV